MTLSHCTHSDITWHHTSSTSAPAPGPDPDPDPAPAPAPAPGPGPAPAPAPAPGPGPDPDPAPGPAPHQVQLQPVTETLTDKQETGDTSVFVQSFFIHHIRKSRRQYFKNECYSEKTKQFFPLTMHNFAWTVNDRKFDPEKQNRAVTVTQMTV